jgi:hypothetical protein
MALEAEEAADECRFDINWKPVILERLRSLD